MKRAILRITDVLLVEIFKGFQGKEFRDRTVRIKSNALPDDAKPIRCQIMDNGMLGILIESESFEDIDFDETKSYPILDSPMFEIKYDNGEKR